MWQTRWTKFVGCNTWVAVFLVLLVSAVAHAQAKGNKHQGPPAVPVRVAPVVEGTVSEQITLVGNTEAIARSTIAAEVSGLVEDFPVREGDFVKKGHVLVRLRSTDLVLRLKAAEATREKVRLNLAFSEKELGRYTKLKGTDSIAESKHDQALDQYQSLKQDLLRTEAEIELLKDDIQKKKVMAPFAGFVAKEHTEVGEWIEVGGPVVSLVDLAHIRITVDVPERYVAELSRKSPVRVVVASISNEPLDGQISAILPEGDLDARTFPVRVELVNPGLKMRSGMEARATFNLGTKKNALLLPKDAIVTAGTNRLVYVVAGSVAQPIPVQVIGYYDGNVSVEGPLKPGDHVVIRGNERLRPGQPVQIIK
jgi:membrane fusion protein (multidrug efflux system)